VRSWALRLANLLALVTFCSFLFSPSAKAAACAPAIATYNGYTYVAFLTVGNCQWSVPNTLTYIDYLVVGGGGSGAARHAGGGGGAGAVGGSANTSTGAPGNGGAGKQWISDFDSTIATTLGLSTTNATSGSQFYFAGGGGGGTMYPIASSGGIGGGGAGSLGSNNATSANANSGGGGGAAGCCNPGYSGAGGSGIVILRYLANVNITISASTPMIFQKANTITAATSIDGLVTFFANGKKIFNCVSVQTVSKVATCNWKPNIHGTINLSASFSPSGSLKSQSGGAKVIFSNSRTGSR
jgi:hypothetical protein